MLINGENRKEVVRPDFNRAIRIDFQGVQITSDTGFLLLREIDDRFKIIAPMAECLEYLRSSTHTKHSLIQMVQQRVYQIAAGYEDCNDADFLRIVQPSGWPSAKTIGPGPASQCSPGWRTRFWVRALA